MRTQILICLAAATLAFGCDDPAEGKAKATVGSAIATASAPPPAAEAKTEKASFSEAQGKVEWEGSKVSGSHTGNFGKFKGEVELVDGKAEGGKVSVDIDMTSVTSDNDQLTKHLLSDDFFSTEKFPAAKFVSTEVKAGGEGSATHTITGNLTMRGETKSISFPATLGVAEKEVTVKSEFSINRKDFGIVYAGKADDLIRDNVVIKLDLKVPRG
ncbi:MAG: YceI family protein [Polyangiaceae bacterium]|nr:YceI family protein [Polyangiaceae bacterium]